jgi:hypothetical protein
MAAGNVESVSSRYVECSTLPSTCHTLNVLGVVCGDDGGVHNYVRPVDAREHTGHALAVNDSEH